MSISNASGTNHWLRRAVVAATALSVAATAAGCGSGEKEKPEASSSPSASKSTDPQAAAKADVLAVYRSYWDAQVKAYAKASPVGTDLDKYAFDKALGKAESELVALKISGNVIKGEPKLSPEVTAVSLDESPKKATITDCVDVTNWKLLKEKTGDEVKLPKERLTRFVTTISARTVGEKWMIVETQQQDRTC
ncbi:hypothetical protein RI578_41010 (plasmid) [Streptomyces sp. BB1-1-1]|uniref:hypothetical protein n=1 Tax=Streptomyces sp. BB1-1-1 TaxID=3074430 RepID=UPI002877E718|nr:hypothetical protein [Streptomyces sp. BB1-1-1]WND40674.1 hypothetical protein RI578_41010 [Streptomyces sp. BB1-1-1]